MLTIIIYLLFSPFSQIASLGSTDWPLRVQSSAKLQSQGLFSLPALLTASHSNDLEISTRAKRGVFAITNPYIHIYKHAVVFYLIYGPDEAYSDIQLPNDFEGPVRYLGPNKTFVKYMDYEYREILHWYTKFYETEQNLMSDNFYLEDTQEEHKERMFMWVEQLRFASRGRVRSNYITD